MYAVKAMTRPVVTVPADATVYQAADILLGSRISAAPVVDADGRMIGIVSEADLMNRRKQAPSRAVRGCSGLLADNASLARDYMRSHSHRVVDVMTREVITRRRSVPRSRTSPPSWSAIASSACRSSATAR